MKILIANTHVPFVRGGAEVLAENLCAELVRRGHHADVVRVPFKWYPPSCIADALLSCRMMDLTESHGESVDLLIPLKFPVHAIRHPRKVAWLLHQHRAAYEFWGSAVDDLHLQPGGAEARDLIHRADAIALGECRHIFTLSRRVSDRLQTNNGIASEPLYHPPGDVGLYRCDSFGDYVYFPSRISRAKRQWLVVEALPHCRTPIRLVISGPHDREADRADLHRRARELGVSSRLDDRGPVSTETKVGLYAGALAIAFTPEDEDYGYIALEGMLAQKPVVLCSDSGGPLEFIRHESEGLVSEPDPRALAAALDRLYDDRALASRLGTAARTRYTELGVSWDRVVDAIIARAT